MKFMAGAGHLMWAGFVSAQLVFEIQIIFAIIRRVVIPIPSALSFLREAGKFL